MIELLKHKGMEYYFYKPDNFNINKKYPLIIFMHGAGERGKVEDSIIHGPIEKIHKGMKIDACILNPYCEGDNLWNNYLERLNELVDIYRKKEFIDIDRVSLTGLSMGGYGCNDLFMTNPSYYSAVLSICGGGKPFSYVYYNNISIWYVHGDSDTIVDPSESIKMYEKIKQINNDCHLTIHKGYGHDVWDITYENEEMINWLINTKRKK